MATTWKMYASLAKEGRLHNVYPAEIQTQCCFSSDPTVRVTATQDDNGAWWGWQEAKGGDDTIPRMVWPTRMQLDMCFPYGLEAAIKAKQGKVVRMTLTVD